MIPINNILLLQDGSYLKEVHPLPVNLPCFVIEDKSFSRGIEKMITFTSLGVALLYAMNVVDISEEGESPFRSQIEIFLILFSIGATFSAQLNRERTAYQIKKYVEKKRGEDFVAITSHEKLIKYFDTLQKNHQLKSNFSPLIQQFHFGPKG
jgi:hypothetical protein